MYRTGAAASPAPGPLAEDYALRKQDEEAIKASLPDNVYILRRRSGWDAAELQADIVTITQKAWRTHWDRYQVIWMSDARKAFAADIGRAPQQDGYGFVRRAAFQRRLGIQLVAHGSMPRQRFSQKTESAVTTLSSLLVIPAPHQPSHWKARECCVPKEACVYVAFLSEQPKTHAVGEQLRAER